MIRSIDGISLSAEYRHNPETGEKKIDFHPTRFDYLGEGYTFMHHDLYRNAKDTVLTNYSKIDLTDKIGMSTVTSTNLIDRSDLVIYTMLKAHNGKYLRVVGDKIYADGQTREENPRIEYDSSYMFKFEKRWDEVRGESYIEVMNGDLYFRTNPFNYTVELRDKEIGDKNDLFKWQISTFSNSEEDLKKILIYSYMDQPWGYGFDRPITKTGILYEGAREFGKTFAYESIEGDEKGTKHYIRYRGVKRYWSVYDGYCPEKIWDGDFGIHADGTRYPLGNLVKSNGILWKNNRKGQPGRYYPNYPDADGSVSETEDRIFSNASNNYILKMDNGSFSDPNSLLLGFDGKIRWVQYYNDFYNKFFNNTLTPKMVIDDIKPNFIVDVPYESGFDNEEKALSFIMSSGRQRIDLMEAKNVETPSYRYALKGNTK